MTQKRLGTVQNFTLTASSQLSSTFGSQTYRILVAHNSTGVNMGGAWIMPADSTSISVSSSNGTFIPSPWLEEFDVTPGQRFALIEASTSHGILSITELW